MPTVTRLSYLLVVLVFVAGCGTRVSDQEARDQLRAAYGGEAAGTALSAPTDELGTPTAGNGEADTSGIATGSEGSKGGPADAPQEAANGSNTGVATGRSVASGAARTGAKSTIVLGMVGDWSGVIGAAFAPARDAYATWAKSVNDRGGILGHPIKLLIADDRNSASNDVALVRDMVENRKAIAIVNLYGRPTRTRPLPTTPGRSRSRSSVAGATTPHGRPHPVCSPRCRASCRPTTTGRPQCATPEQNASGALYCTEVPTQSVKWFTHLSAVDSSWGVALVRCRSSPGARP